ncbi:hypothetical protein WJX73_005458 [Symbiochloris irregularis]|uniref:Uncharacterized protein n=1 Tax=Symbiochloris irregularis TaxID=706552 RepID=A0AAW1PI37_9CHLO
MWHVDPTGEATSAHRLQAHDRAAAFLAFSPNDSLLLTCGHEPAVKLWNAVTGGLLQTYTHHTLSLRVTSVAWMPDGRRFLSSSVDKTIVMCGTDGKPLQRHTLRRINDMRLAGDGRMLIAVTDEHKLSLTPLHDGFEMVLVRLVAHSVQLWHLDPLSQQLEVAAQRNLQNPDDKVATRAMARTPAMQYSMEVSRPGHFIIRDYFGGASNSIVATGSEDGHARIWHRATGKLLAQLKHPKTVNSVACNPTNLFMLATACDDHKGTDIMID